MSIVEAILDLVQHHDYYTLGPTDANQLIQAVQRVVVPLPQPLEVREAVWKCIRTGLVFIDYEQDSTNNWYLRLTQEGKGVLANQLPNPDEPAGYLDRLKRDVPSISKDVTLYVTESLNSYTARCYLASAVMLGVASESAFITMATALSRSIVLPHGHEKLSHLILQDKNNFSEKFHKVRQRLQEIKHTLPDSVQDGIALSLDAVADLLRINRNEAGHPTGRVIDKADAFNALVLFARYLAVLETLRLHFIANPLETG